MNIDIRKAVMHNVKNNQENDFAEIIEDAIMSKEEKTLPGLGVLFELFWKNADETNRNLILQTLSHAAKA